MPSKFYLAILCSLCTYTALAAKDPLILPEEKATVLPIQIEKRSHVNKLSTLIFENRWTKVGREVEKGFKHSTLKMKDLAKIAKTYPQSPFSKALEASKRISKLRNCTPPSFHTLFPIALFAETRLKKELSKGHHFWEKNKFGKELQADPKTKELFIHLGDNKKNIIGKGRQKLVIKTIRYNSKHPEVMAYGYTKSGIDREVKSMKALRNLPHVMNMRAFLSHKDPHSKKKLNGIVTKIYNSGSLQDIIYKRHHYRLTLKEKIKIASDLVTGLHAMHSKKFAHRDLGAKNYFINIEGKKPGKRRITGCVADMGRTAATRNIVKMAVQGNSYYMPPEGFFLKKMRKKDYYQSDLFAFGCAMWNMYYGKLPEWSYKRYFKQEHGSTKSRQHHLISMINKVRHDKLRELNKQKSSSPRVQFQKLIIKMTDPSPHKRGTTGSAKYALKRMLKKA
jgi:serine/threonine protein kinase